MCLWQGGFLEGGKETAGSGQGWWGEAQRDAEERRASG